MSIPDPCHEPAIAVAAVQADIAKKAAELEPLLDLLIERMAVLERCRQQYPWVGTYIDPLPMPEALRATVKAAAEKVVRWWRTPAAMRKKIASAKRLKSACHDFCNTP